MNSTLIQGELQILCLRMARWSIFRALAREKQRPEDGVLGVVIRRRHRVEMGWFDTFYTFSQLGNPRRRAWCRLRRRGHPAFGTALLFGRTNTDNLDIEQHHLPGILNSQCPIILGYIYCKNHCVDKNFRNFEFVYPGDVGTQSLPLAHRSLCVENR